MNELKNKPHPVDVHVGSKLRKRRSDLGVSQEELGEAVNLTFQQIQKYEKGYNRISSSKLFEFSKFLKTSVDYFFKEIENYNFGDTEAPLTLSDKVAEEYSANVSKQELEQLYTAYASIKDEGVRKNVMNLINSISKDSQKDSES